MLGEFGERDPFEFGEGVAERGDDDAVLVEEGPGVDVGMLDRQVDDRSVEAFAETAGGAATWWWPR